MTEHYRRRRPGFERRRRRFPRWAERERAGDLEWIRENLEGFWTATEPVREELGRGALLIDTRVLSVHEGGMGHPMMYVPQEVIAEKGDEDALRVVGEYDPGWELVVILLKPRERESIYRVGLARLRPGGESTR